MSKTIIYIAADWDNDKEVVDKLREWNNSDKYSLDFSDAHDLTQSRDTSLYCSIKSSLSKRLRASKIFILIVGEHTKNLTKGKCSYCEHYNKYNEKCSHNNNLDMDSYIEYECNWAVYYGLKIIVIYNSNTVDRNKCPIRLKHHGTHIPAFQIIEDSSEKKWNYEYIKDFI